MDMRQVWVMGLMAVAGCARPVASSAPLQSAPTEATSPATTAAAAAAPSSMPKAAAAPSSPARRNGRQALLQRSCDLGSAIGCNDLGILAWADPERALPLLERACTLGLPRGCANFGVELLRGPRHDQELDHALELLGGACEHADGYACAELGDTLYAGRERIGQAALGKAHGAYEKACRLEYVEACVSDGWLQRDGEGAAQSSARALELFRFACDKQTYSGCAALGFALLTDAKNKAEFEEGVRWLNTACEHEQPLGCFMLGNLARHSNAPDALKRAGELFNRACKLGSAEGCRFAEDLKKQPPPAAPPTKAPPNAADDDDDDDPGEDQDDTGN